jgi:hypothetical protein
MRETASWLSDALAAVKGANDALVAFDHRGGDGSGSRGAVPAAYRSLSDTVWTRLPCAVL